jgi:radical SAM superfamily enzyme YgiQ (UPF0313 family)
MLWTAMTRTDLLVQRFDQWRSQGLAGVMIGIESMDQRALDSLEKQTSAERLGHAAELCRRHGIVLVGFYIIGLESDTEESVRAGIRRLAALGCDLVQVCVLTPLPQTPLWRRIEERYGFDERDYSRFDGKHLVWKHPALTKGLVRDLLAWSYGILYPPSNPVQTLRKFTRAHVGRLGLWRTLPHLVGSSLKLNLCPVRQLPMLMRHPAAAGA